MLIPAGNAQNSKKKERKGGIDNVQVSKRLAPKPMPTLEINVIGKTVAEALPDVEAFIDSAVIANLEEVRIVHGVGTGKTSGGNPRLPQKAQERSGISARQIRGGRNGRYDRQDQVSGEEGRTKKRAFRLAVRFGRGNLRTIEESSLNQKTPGDD